ncbi:hypothetical protein SLEP1_g17558 [Rubroshorea leprosula]|uniref:PB1-like domain-containing protein n=1 Tax=Rubroshorea leprosula TaxID=152421 RepID=A0AAV5J0I0_9ROSI|nr:hypothetical protein SLEP1_g17558 [Rubroshorea leprosula]
MSCSIILQSSNLNPRFARIPNILPRESKLRLLESHSKARLMDPNVLEIVDVDLEPSKEILDDEVELFDLYTKIGIVGYDVDMVNHIWYLEPRKTLTDGLKPIRNDDDIRDVLRVLKVEKKVYIYVSHIPDFIEIEIIPILLLPALSDKVMVDNNLVEVEGIVENDLVKVESRAENVGHEVEVECKVEDNNEAVEEDNIDLGNDGNEDNEYSKDEDDFFPYISKLSDNEDKKIVETRKKMKSLHEATCRSKNAKNSVNYGRSQPLAQIMISTTFEQVKRKEVKLNMLGEGRCRIIKKKLRKTFEGDYVLECSKFFDYAVELRKRDPRATVSVNALRPLLELDLIFLRMYVCFSAMKKEFIIGCRKAIGLDGAFLKRPHEGELLTVLPKTPSKPPAPALRKLICPALLGSVHRLLLLWGRNSSNSVPVSPLHCRRLPPTAVRFLAAKFWKRNQGWGNHGK